MADFFYSAFVDVCSELGAFATAVINNPPGISTVIYTSFWTDQAASGFTSQITESGQYLYKYDSNLLYVSSLTFPFSSYSPSAGTLFIYGGTFYVWSQGTLQQVSDPTTYTAQQRQAAIPLVYFGTNPSSVSGTAENQYCAYGGNVYKSSRSASFSSASIPSGAALVAPQGRVYKVDSGVLVNLPSGIEDTVTLSLTLADNWNEGLQTAMYQAVSNYCISYALYSWFTVTAPRIAEKYLGDMKRNLTAVVRMAHEKLPPTPASPPSSPLDITTSIT